MSPYAEALANARLDALRTLIDALNEAETPEEKRRCAVAIFNAPDPCDLDDEIELVDDDEDEIDEAETDDEHEDEADDENEVADDDDPIDDLEEDDTENLDSTSTPQPTPSSLAAVSVGRCDGAATSPLPAPPPALPHTPLPRSPSILLPAPTGPAAQLIAAAGRSP